MVTIISFYKYVQIQNPEFLRNQIVELCNKLNLLFREQVHDKETHHKLVVRVRKNDKILKKNF